MIYRLLVKSVRFLLKNNGYRDYYDDLFPSLKPRWGDSDVSAFYDPHMLNSIKRFQETADLDIMATTLGTIDNNTLLALIKDDHVEYNTPSFTRLQVCFIYSHLFTMLA